MVLRLTLFRKRQCDGETDTNLSDLRNVNAACVRCELEPVSPVLEGELPGARYWVQTSGQAPWDPLD